MKNRTRKLSTDDSGVTNISLHDLLNLSRKQPVSSRYTTRHQGMQSGALVTRQRGQGAEYDDLRPYSAGDDVRHIDWRASARTACLQTRLFRAEKEQRIFVVTDLRDCMFTGSERLRAVTATELSARIIWQACQSGARLTQLCVDEHGLSLSECGVGSNAGVSACRLLADCFRQQRQRSGSGGFQASTSTVPTHTTLHIPARSGRADLALVLKYLMQQRRQGAGIIWISGMDSPGEDFIHLLKTRDQRDQYAFVEVYDSLLYKGLPRGRYAYQSIRGSHFSARTLQVNSETRKSLTAALHVQHEQLRHTFNRLGIPWLTFADDENLLVPRLQGLGLLP